MTEESDGTLTQTADSPTVLHVSISCDSSVPSDSAKRRSAPFVPQSAGLNHGWRIDDRRTKSGKLESVEVTFPDLGLIVIE